MSTDLLLALEQKVNHAVETIELLRLQLEELEEENIALKAEREKWRSDLTALIRRFDEMEIYDGVNSEGAQLAAEADNQNDVCLLMV